MLKEYNLMSDMERSFLNAVRNNEYELVRTQWVDESKYISGDIINRSLMECCSKGHLDILEYLLTNLGANRNTQHLDLNYKQGVLVIKASINNHVHVLDFLLKSPKLKTHASLKEDRVWYRALDPAMRLGQLAVVEYFFKNYSIPPWVLERFYDSKISDSLRASIKLIETSLAERAQLEKLIPAPDKNSLLNLELPSAASTLLSQSGKNKI